jgi:hypothetical protein
MHSSGFLLKDKDLTDIEPTVIQPLEQIFHIMLDLELLEKVHVFILEGLFGVMLFLIQNVIVHISNLRMAV